MENYFKMNFDEAQVKAISNLGLAHMGDCVFEILCRAYLCTRGNKTVDKLHRDTINMVKATSQAKFMEKLLPLLTEEELEQVTDLVESALRKELGMRLALMNAMEHTTTGRQGMPS